MSEAGQTFTILNVGVVGQDIPNDDFCYQDGDVGYVILYDDSSEICYVGQDELEKYDVIPHSIAHKKNAVWTISNAETRAYCKPKACFNPSCEDKSDKTLRCSKCLWAKYCSVSCQRLHWKEHKPECDQMSLTHECMKGREGYTYKSKAPKDNSTH